MTKHDTDLTKDNLSPNGDAFYESLMSAHEGLDHDQSEKLNARLILLMANVIGDGERLKLIIDKAKEFEDK